jgi:type IV pilus assembly protein PilA
MLSKSLNRRRDDDGFTLIELLVVVVILGILIGIAIPVYLNYRKSANDKAAQSDLRGAISTLEVCNSENGGYPTSATLPGAPCTGQTVTGSSGTTMSYSGTATSYKIVSNNTGGSGKWYCYNSSTGGSVRDVSSTTVNTATLALAACT